MRTADSVSVAASETGNARVEGLVRVWDFVELSKPKIAVMGLVTVSIGYALGLRTSFDGLAFLHSLLGIGLVAIACSALNQVLEVRTDRLMQRTADRPLPAGRIQRIEALCFGLGCGVAGTIILATKVNTVVAWWSFATLVMYVAVYTPLKRVSFLSTFFGALAGAMPPLLGWVAAGGRLNFEAGLLFAILFLWQFPHFVAIAWLYRRQYSAAGLCMLPGGMPRRGIAGSIAATYALILVPASVLPGLYGIAGNVYSIAALTLSTCYLIASLWFLTREDDRTARALLYVSLVYLPVLLCVMTWDHWRLLTM